MSIHLMRHPDGPELPADAKGKCFRSYADLADWADKNLPYGVYYIAPPWPFKNLASMRETHHEPGRFYVEGRGNI